MPRRDDEIPAACEMSCDPGADRFAGCRRAADCPCTREDSEARKRAFAAWLLSRLETVRLRERGQREGPAAADGHTATAWRALARMLLAATNATEQHLALARWSEAVLGGSAARERLRLALLLRPDDRAAAALEEEAPAPAFSPDALSPRQQWALQRARAGGRIDSREIARQFGVSREQGRQDLALLVQLGLLARRGVSRGTVYMTPEQAASEPARERNK